MSELGEKIFLDRYALKDMAKENLAVGDIAVVCVNTETGQREVGTVAEIRGHDVVVVLGGEGAAQERVTRAMEHVDRPLETHPDQLQARVARGIASVEPADRRSQWEANFRWLLEGWKFVPGGRILTAAGTDQNLTYYNCYVIQSPHDSRGGIIQTLSQMTEIMSRGGGVGINVSSLRPRYAYVRGVNGRSSGAVSWGSLFSFVTGLIEQGGSRRGALMLILDVWHPDIAEFINAKRVMGRITNANISVGVTDDFMAAVEADASWDLVFPDTSDGSYESDWRGDLPLWRAAGRPVVKYKTVQARELWQTIIESAWASAEPGLWFSERANRMSNSHYYAPLVCTNPCVAGETLVHTGQGLARADDLHRRGGSVEVIADRRFGAPAGRLAASPMVFTGRKKAYRLETEEGYRLRATPDHQIMTTRGWARLGELEPGDRVHIVCGEGAFGAEGTLGAGLKLGYGTAKRLRLGQRVADAFASAPLRQRLNAVVGAIDCTTEGWRSADRQADPAPPSFAGAEKGLRGSFAEPPTPGRAGTESAVPAAVLGGSRAMQCGFLQALFTVYGHFDSQSLPAGRVCLAVPDRQLLEGIQCMLLSFGIVCRLGPAAAAADQSALVIHGPSLSTFAAAIGFLTDDAQQALGAHLGRQGSVPPDTFTATVAAVHEDGEADVYDLAEPVTHAFVANGIVVHNCGEQPLPAWAVCNLGAINLARFAGDGSVDWETLGVTVRYSVRFLDNVIDSTPYFFEENERQQKAERRVGLGTMGLAELMIRCGVRYGSPEGNAFCDQLYRFIASEAYLASADNALEKGSFPMLEPDQFLQSGFMQAMPLEVRQAITEKGIRNVTLLTQAPTGTTGTMVGTSTGIEPFYSWTFLRKSRLGMHEERVQVLQEWQSAHPAGALPDYFVTAMDLSPEEHVGLQATIQRWVDSSISKTCNVPNDYTVDQTRELYELMYRSGCKGGTVYRDRSRDEQVLVRTDEAATSGAESERVVKPRPRQMAGTTYRIVTPLGKAYITVNRNSEDKPFEVFVNLGKAGSDLAADAEAIGRLISLILRMPSSLSPEERLQKVADELAAIGGSRVVGFGAERVRSLPDGISHALREDLDGEVAEIPAKQMGLLLGADLCPVCGHASFVHEEGCQKCYSCGHSEC